MNRLTASLALAVAFGLVALGIAWASPTAPQTGAETLGPVAAAHARDARSAQSESPDATSLDFWISDARDGDEVHSVVSATNQVWAVLGFEGATNEDYHVQMRDLSGILVESANLRANGTGRVSTPISVTQFANTYLGILDPNKHTPTGSSCASEACTMTESVNRAAANCEAAPPVPPMWPEPPHPTAGPGQPTATPDPQDPYRLYRLWLDDTLSAGATSRQAMAEITRTNQALLSMPDAAANAVIKGGADLSTAKIIHGYDALKQAERLLNPPDQLPDTVEGCRLVREAQQDVADSDAQYAKIAPQMTDVSGWRFPPTVARWAGNRFVACIQYQVELSAGTGEHRADVDWAVGEPGPPRLIFPSARLVEAANLGEMSLTMPEGANAMYAQSVTVPSANHKATVSAYVTDAACIPVDGGTMDFSIIDHPEAGELVPVSAPIASGIASAELTAGQDAQNHLSLQGFVQTSSTPAPDGIKAIVPFNIVGPADSNHLTFLMRRDREINMAEDPTLNFSVQVRDEFGRSVADGSVLEVSVPDSDPAQIGYQKVSNRPAVPGQPTPTPELVLVGKQYTMLTRAGMSQFPESTDPGFVDVGPLLVCTDEGGVTLTGVIDGATANTNDPDTGFKTITCVSRYAIALPVVLKHGDVHPPRTTPLPIETPTPHLR